MSGGSIFSSEEICKHPLNTSKAKAQYSFNRARRFQPTQKFNCLVGCYDPPNMKNSRSTGFGFGKKTDFTISSQLVNPAPTSYHLKGAFEKPSTAGFSFGIRPKIGSILNTTTAINNPGPGSYTPKHIGHNRSYSLGSRTKHFTEINDEKKNAMQPGPGAYTPLASLNSTGNYFNSKWKGSGAGVISPSSCQRFNPRAYTTEVPGPGSYEAISTKASGHYFASNYSDVRSPKFSFGLSRDEFNKRASIKDTPGPGSYILPSDFGVYVSSKTHNLSNSASSSFLIRSRQTSKEGSRAELSKSSTTKQLHALLNEAGRPKTRELSRGNYSKGFSQNASISSIETAGGKVNMDSTHDENNGHIFVDDKNAPTEKQEQKALQKTDETPSL